MSVARVLLADSNLGVLETVTRLLESEFEVIGRISDGSSLMTAAVKLNPDVLIVDVQVPGLSGFEAVRRLRKRRVRSAIIFLTAHHDRALAEEAQFIGAMGYVLKPAAENELRPAIREALQGSFFLSSALRTH
jgi:two-component system secretion response regulator SsrB